MNIYERFGRTRFGIWWFLHVTLPRRYVWMQSKGLRLHPIKLRRLLRDLERTTRTPQFSQTDGIPGRLAGRDDPPP